jgi:hypothetical protein
MFKTYSQAILAGLELRTISSASVREQLTIPTGRFSKILKGTAEFTDREEEKIEQFSGRTTGQLAAASIEPNGGRLTELAKLWGNVHEAAQAAMKAQRKPAKRAAKPRRATKRQLV